MAEREAVLVTGANRGIGLEVCRQLAAKGARVLLAARDEARGREAAATITGAAGGTVEAVALDVTDDASVARVAQDLARRGVALRALVNNAGVALDGFNAKVARETIDVNVRGVVRVTEGFLPRVVPGGCVVMVSSGIGALEGFPRALRPRFEDRALDRDGLLALVEGFVAAVRAGDHEAQGWPSSAYRVSKVALNAYTQLVARAQPALRVNAVCPGWVRTAMGGQSAPRSVEEGAAGIVWAATLGADGPTGGFFRDGHAIEW